MRNRVTNAICTASHTSFLPKGEVPSDIPPPGDSSVGPRIGRSKSAGSNDHPFLYRVLRLQHCGSDRTSRRDLVGNVRPISSTHEPLSERTQQRESGFYSVGAHHKRRTWSDLGGRRHLRCAACEFRSGRDVLPGVSVLSALPLLLITLLRDSASPGSGHGVVQSCRIVFREHT